MRLMLAFALVVAADADRDPFDAIYLNNDAVVGGLAERLSSRESSPSVVGWGTRTRT